MGRPDGPSWLETGRRKSPAASGMRGPPRLLPTGRLQRPSVCSTWSGLRAEPQAGASGCAGAALRAGEVFGARGSLPQKSKRAKAGGAADAGSARALLEGPSPLGARSATTARGWHPRSHGVVWPSIVVSGTLSLPGTCRPRSHTVSTCQSLAIGHLQQTNLPCPQLPPRTTADPPSEPQSRLALPAQARPTPAPALPAPPGLLQAPPMAQRCPLASGTPRPPPHVLHRPICTPQPAPVPSDPAPRERSAAAPGTRHTQALSPVCASVSPPPPTRDTAPDPGFVTIPVGDKGWVTSRLRRGTGGVSAGGGSCWVVGR